MLPVRMAKRNCSEQFEDTRTPMLEPHKVIDYLFTQGGVKIDPADVKEFWHIKRNLGKEEWAVQSPASDTHIPIALYGDGCRFQNHTVKMVGIFISLPLWKATSTRCSRFCIWAVEESRFWKRTTLDTVLQRITYSLNLLFDGVDEFGRTIASGNEFTVTGLRGDWLWHRECFAFSSTWKAPRDVCYLCTAAAKTRNPAQLYYNYWDDEPDWHEYNLLEWINAQQGHRTRTCIPT